MSLTVISPRSSPSPLTTSSFSMRCLCRISAGSSRVVPSGTVTRFSLVITSRTCCARVLDEAQVAVGQDADQLLALGDRHAADPVVAHQGQGLVDGLVRPQGDRLGDHARFASA